MSLEKSLDHLSHITCFSLPISLQSLSEERESCISALSEEREFNAESHKMQQISGQILAYDQILKMTNAEDILFRNKSRTT
jgi:hypothetical protein